MLRSQCPVVVEEEEANGERSWPSILGASEPTSVLWPCPITSDTEVVKKWSSETKVGEVVKLAVLVAEALANNDEHYEGLPSSKLAMLWSRLVWESRTSSLHPRKIFCKTTEPCSRPSSRFGALWQRRHLRGYHPKASRPRLSQLFELVKVARA